MTLPVSVTVSGSSPRAWGASHGGPHGGPHARFIPTCVGSMIERVARFQRVSVHPHVRGEHSVPLQMILTQTGSSPRAWGACGDPELFAGAARFIPTCVGSIACPVAADPPPPVHPHVRGEHCNFSGSVNYLLGSSPRAWGALNSPPPQSEAARFIPTCVGSIAPAALVPLNPAVHPHVRGEHEIEILDFIGADGSSPRAWGAWRRGGEMERRQRFIPTCVGSINP